MVYEEVLAGRPYQKAVTLFGVEPLYPALLTSRLGFGTFPRLRGRLGSLDGRRGALDDGAGSLKAIAGLVGRISLQGTALRDVPGDLEYYGVFGNLDHDRSHVGPVLLPDRVVRYRGVEPHAPPVALAVVEHALEDAHRLAGAPLTAVYVVAGPERLHAGGAGAQSVGDPLVGLARIYPLPDLGYMRLEGNALLRLRHAPISPYSPLVCPAGRCGKDCSMNC